MKVRTWIISMMRLPCVPTTLHTTPHALHLNLIIIVGHQVLLGEITDRHLIRTNKDGMLCPGSKVALAFDTMISIALCSHSPSIALTHRLVELYTNPDTAFSNLSLSHKLHGSTTGYASI